MRLSIKSIRYANTLPPFISVSTLLVEMNITAVRGFQFNARSCFIRYELTLKQKVTTVTPKLSILSQFYIRKYLWLDETVTRETSFSCGAIASADKRLTLWNWSMGFCVVCSNAVEFRRLCIVSRKWVTLVAMHTQQAMSGWIEHKTPVKYRFTTPCGVESWPKELSSYGHAVQMITCLYTAYDHSISTWFACYLIAKQQTVN